METRDIYQIQRFATDRFDCYTCLMDARKHSSFTGDEARIEDAEGKAFTAFGGYINGKNLSLERGRKIVQSWRANEPEWPLDYFSEVVFEFRDIEGGCELKLQHKGVPGMLVEQMEKGWTEFYWEPLRIYLER